MKLNWKFSFISKVKCFWAHVVNFFFNKKERKKKKGKKCIFLFNKLELNAAKKIIILNDALHLKMDQICIDLLGLAQLQRKCGQMAASTDVTLPLATSGSRIS